MNILILDSWLREYLKTKATPQKIAEVLSLCGPSVERLTKIDNDWLYDIEVTTNRVDLMSVIGIAEEATAILPQFGIRAIFQDFHLYKEKKGIQNKLTVHIADPQKLCKRILGVVIDNLKIGPSPETIQKRLKASGIRSLNNLVDITNYVMLEVGHPTHVFDYDRLTTKKLFFRKSKKGEKIISLEDKSYSLPGDDIIIDNGKGVIIDLPGIIGTANSIVTNDTKRILFFIESCEPAQIRKSSMILGIRTQAATINEKSVSPSLSKIALLRGMNLYQKLYGGKIASKIYDLYEKPDKSKQITVTEEQINKVLGINLTAEKSVKILNSLGIKSKINPQKEKEIVSLIPFWRSYDLNLPEDLIEEIARIHGYHNLPSTLMSGLLPEHSSLQTKIFSLEAKVKNFLSNWGYTETYTYSMQSKEEIIKCGLPLKKHLRIANPLSLDWEYLRISLLPSLLQVIKNNVKQKKTINLFELSNVYYSEKNNLPREKSFLIIGEAGENRFYNLKGTVEELFGQLGIIKYAFEISSTQPCYYQAGKTLTIKKQNLTLGYLGPVSQMILNNLGINIPLIIAEFDFAAVVKTATLIKTYTPIPVYPPILEDFSFIFPEGIQLGPVLSEIKGVNPQIINVDLIDKYESTITFRLTFQDPKKPLTNQDIIPLRKQLVLRLKEKFNAGIKGKI